MKIVKKNQIIIFAIALLLITVGYFNYDTENVDGLVEASSIMDSEEMAAIGDATLVNSGELVENVESKDVLEENSEAKKTEKVETTSSEISNYFTESRLTRDKMYSQMLESYQKILESTNISETQKQIATQEISNINNKKNAIMIAENLIKNKGVEEVIIFINDKSISVIVKNQNLTEEQIAQIQNIVTRELNADINNIHISTKS